MIGTTGPAQGGSSQEPAAGPSLASRPSVQEIISPAPDPSPAPVLAEAVDSPFLSRDEKRRILAQIVRVNALDCFDDTGAFDIARARRVLPPGAIRGFMVHETTRIDAEGQPNTQRRIHVRLVDPVSALRLDDLLERRREPAASSDHSDSPSSSPSSSKTSFNLLREETMALDEAHQSIALLKQALAEADDLALQLSKELEEKDAPRETAPRATQTAPAPDSRNSALPSPEEPKPQNRSSLALQSRVQSEAPVPIRPTLPNRDQSPQRGACCQPVKPESHSSGDLKELEALCFQREIEDAKNSMGAGAFSDWLQARGINPATYRSPSLCHQTTVKRHMARPSARPPPKLHPMSFSAQGICKYV